VGVRALLRLVALALALTLAAAPSAAAAIPNRNEVRAAKRYLNDRRGSTSLAIVNSAGRLRGLRPRHTYIGASVVKAMLLVAYLRSIRGRMPTPGERAALGPMITRSDNDSADAVYRRLGDAPLVGLARKAGMRDFSVAYHWGSARVSAADQARFMRRFDRLTPLVSRAYARRLMSSIVTWQRWGFTRAARRAGFEIFFKGGWRRTPAGRLVHESALLERDGRRFSVAVLSDGNPSHDYGTATLRGVASRLLAPRNDPESSAVGHAIAAAGERPPRAGNRATRRAGLANVLRYAPGLRLDLRYLTRRNITGERLPGYCRPWALLLRPAARDLARVQRLLRRRGHGLLVVDAYRPTRATRALVDWARRTGRGHLVGTYIASRSNHNLGSAVDLTLVRRRDGRRLRMGGGYDRLSARAHTLNASGAALRNRLELKAAMERFGFRNYHREWWHYDHRARGSRYLDLTLGCEN
jgi:D-alanyl-D-alanine dipeptidase